MTIDHTRCAGIFDDDVINLRSGDDGKVGAGANRVQIGIRHRAAPAVLLCGVNPVDAELAAVAIIFVQRDANLLKSINNMLAYGLWLPDRRDAQRTIFAM